MAIKFFLNKAALATRLVLSGMLLVISFSMKAQDTLVYEKHLYIDHQDKLPYRLLLPSNYDPSKEYPLILFLHGAGERGRDNVAQLKHGGAMFLRDSIRLNYPAIVVVPQCPANSFWSNVQIKVDSAKFKAEFNFQENGDPTIAMKLLMGLIKTIDKQYKIDPSRRYVGGLSMGGMGTYELVRRKHNYFAAAFAICGGANTATAKKITGPKWWIFHGDKDVIVPVHFSQDIATALKNEGADVRLTIYPNVNHNSWDNAFEESELFPWLFAQHK